MKKSLFMLMLGCLFMSSQVIAQMTVSGTVTDVGDEPLIGVNIVEKGTTNGTVTDLDGNYSIKVADGSTLVFSYVGFESQELAAASTLNVVLQEAGILDEVVVSALAIERNSREVVYANQTVKSDELISVPNKTALEALRGKLAGVKISTNSGNVGSSTRIVARGESSLTGNNNVLIVIDGVPIDNASSRGGDGNSSNYVDYGNRFNDLNPDDIESLTLLKGPAATSLYGSRGASGVLLVTTKKGGAEDGSMKIDFNHSTSFEQAYILLQRQDQYGQGFALPFAGVEGGFDTGENWSWGPRLDGVVRPWTSPVDADGDGDYEFLSRPFSAVPNQLRDFFDIGVTTSNGISLAGTKGKFNYYTSYNNVYQKGMLTNTDYKRNTFTFNASAQLHEKIKTDFSINYARIGQNGASDGSRPFEGTSPYAQAVQAPNTIPYTELRDYNSPFHNFDGYYGTYTINPYYILGEYVNNGEFSNLFGKLGVTFTPIEGLTLTARAGANQVQREITEVIPKFAYNGHYIWEDNLNWFYRPAEAQGGDRQSNEGSYSKVTGTNLNIDLSTLANYTKAFGSDQDHSINATVGYNFFQRQRSTVSGSTVGGLVIPEFYNLSNSVQAAESAQSSSKYRIYGVFGNINYGWNNMLFVEYSLRNDWSSTLPQENNSFFYQAGGVSAILTEIDALKNNKWFNYFKVRGSVGTTGKDAGLYLIESVFNGNQDVQNLTGTDHDLNGQVNGQATFTQDNLIGNPELKPELTLTYEAGADLAIIENRINIEYTWYQSNHNDQIVIVGLPRSSGFTQTARNIGKMTNTGHELAVNVKPVKGVKDFSWDLNFQFAKNVNEVVKVADDIDELVIYTLGDLSLVAAEGQPFGAYKGQQMRMDPNGNVIVDANTGRPLIEADPSLLGSSYQPDFTASVGTDIGWKGLSFNILFDIKQGGEFVSLTKDNTEFNGTAMTTFVDDRSAFVVPGSVVEVDNGDGTFSYVENTVETNPYEYLADLNISESLIDASYVKLRELGLSYQLPSKLFDNTPIRGVRVGFAAKNVKFWLPDENTFADPEVNGPALTGNGVGIETTTTPPARSYGFNVNVSF